MDAKRVHTGLFRLEDGRALIVSEERARCYLGPVPLPWKRERVTMSLTGRVDGPVPLWTVEPRFMRRQRR